VVANIGNGNNVNTYGAFITLGHCKSSLGSFNKCKHSTAYVKAKQLPSSEQVNRPGLRVHKY